MQPLPKISNGFYKEILAALSNIQIAQSERPIFEMNNAENENFEISRNVFDEAIALAKSSKATLTLLHVISEHELKEGIKEFGDQEKFEQECQRRLKLLKNEATAKGIEVFIPDQVSFQLVFGSPGELICDHARRWKNDLIVVGRRERHFHLLGPGSVSDYVIHHAPCTTFIVNSLTSISAENAVESGATISPDSNPSIVLIQEIVEVEK